MSWKPERDIEIVAGTPPGGGLDRSDASVYPTDMSRVPPHAEITPQRPDWLAEDAVRRETVSRANLPCNLQFAGRFSEIAGRADPTACPVS